MFRTGCRVVRPRHMRDYYFFLINLARPFGIILYGWPCLVCIILPDLLEDFLCTLCFLRRCLRGDIVLRFLVFLRRERRDTKLPKPPNSSKSSAISGELNSPVVLRYPYPMIICVYASFYIFAFSSFVYLQQIRALLLKGQRLMRALQLLLRHQRSMMEQNLLLKALVLQAS